MLPLLLVLDLASKVDVIVTGFAKNRKYKTTRAESRIELERFDWGGLLEGETGLRSTSTGGVKLRTIAGRPLLSKVSCIVFFSAPISATPSLLTTMPCLAIGDVIHREIVRLPTWPGVSENHIERVIKSLRFGA